MLAQLKCRGAKFADLYAKKYSEDPGSKDSGGEAARWMPTLWASFWKVLQGCHGAQSGTNLGPMVKTQFGYHIIQTVAKQ